jgi:hypothetical protein
MSTFLYAAMTSKRVEGRPGTTTSTQPPGVGTYVDAFAALVPAEVLGVHATILTFTTEVVRDARGATAIAITEVATLRWVFWALLALSMALYALPRIIRSRWDRWDWVRVAIPPLAFVGWTMLQKATAFDAVAPGMSSATRNAVAIIGGVFLGVIAAQLAHRADRKQPPP